ncbi:uncharacterized protein LOC123498868 [Portunus trituberculatus]|uniref:uncharacterized protein LOC123498868 n=1 Tax=Portunus trituberculatus TaxID=210409 RepID=UPI001E1CFB1E|nr:uncharacterized protein LOC123498868 [Portunus trituberculatus]XP_045102283.1 uncharacterized protein LOC123498868 [Portunus trituberculatus]
MGGNQVKAATRSPLLHVESVTLTSEENHERRFRKKLPRRLGSMLLADWVRLKRRELEVITKGKVVLDEGRAPPEIVQELEMYMKSASKKIHIKYHPKIAPKPKNRFRLTGPRLTQTAARRIQDAYNRREKEQQQQQKRERLAQKREKSRLSVRSQGWTEQGTSRSSKRTRTGRLSQEEQKRASSLPPTSTLSLQSITTAESSGIGMSRASSLTSVASIRHKKTFFSRQRGQSSDTDDTGGQNLRLAKQRSGRRASPLMVKHNSPSGHNPTPERGAAAKQRWTVALRQSFQQVMQQKERKQTGSTKTRQANMQQKTTKRKENLEPQRSHSGNLDMKQVTSVNHQEVERHQEKLKKDGEVTLQVPDTMHRASPSSLGSASSDKKEQGSQTRLSGPPKPRRLLLLRPGKNKVKQEDQQKSPVQQKAGCSVFPNKINPKEKWKRLLRMNKKDTADKEHEEQKGSITSNNYQVRGQRLQSSPNVRRRASVDVNMQRSSGQRRHSQPMTGLASEAENPESISPADPQHFAGTERIIRVSRHPSPNDGGEVIIEQQMVRRVVPQQSTTYEGEYCRSDKRYELTEEQHIQSQGENTLVVSSSDVGYNEPIMSHGGSRRSSGERNMESDGNQGRFSESQLPSDDQSAGFSGRGVTTQSSRTVEEINFNPEEQMAVRPLGMVDQGRTVESQGSRRPGSFAGRGQDLIHDRGRMSAISLDHGIVQAPLEARLITERGSPDRLRQRDSLIDYGRNEHPVEILHGEAPIRATESIHRGSIVERVARDSSTERMHQNALVERGRRESLVEYPRIEGSIDRVRPDVLGRGAALSERNGDRILPRVTQDRGYIPSRIDRGYSYEPQDERRGRQYQERRYTVGTVEPSYLAGFTERQIIGRLSEPDSSRIYSGRIPYSRALDSDPVRSRSIDYEFSKPYSESDYPGRFVDHEPAKIYAERLVAAGRLRNTEDYDLRERGGRYRDAVITQHSVASAPLVDHRSL